MMIQKKLINIIIAFFLVTSFIALPCLTFAQESDSTESASKKDIRETINERREEVQNRLQEQREELRETLQAKREEVKERILEGLRRSIEARVRVANRIFTRVEVLLIKLDESIARAKAAGEDTSEMENLMADSYEKLANAKSKIDDIKEASGSAETREDFKEIHELFHGVREDLHTIKQNSAKVISLLKEFNASERGIRESTKSTTPTED